MIKDPDINRAIHDVLHAHGLSIGHRAESLKRLINHQDPTSVYRGLDMANEIAEDDAPIRIEHDIGILIARTEAMPAEEQTTLST